MIITRKGGGGLCLASIPLVENVNTSILYGGHFYFNLNFGYKYNDICGHVTLSIYIEQYLFTTPEYSFNSLWTIQDSFYMDYSGELTISKCH